MEEPIYCNILLQRIVRVLSENNSLSRTELSKKARIHYSRMIEQLERLEQYKCTRLEIKDGKVHVMLTRKGKVLAKRLMSLDRKANQ